MTEDEQNVEISVNAETRRVHPDTTIDDLVAELGVGRRGVAVAVDGIVVPRSSWDRTSLTAGARVELLRAVQGG